MERQLLRLRLDTSTAVPGLERRCSVLQWPKSHRTRVRSAQLAYYQFISADMIVTRKGCLIASQSRSPSRVVLQHQPNRTRVMNRIELRLAALQRLQTVNVLAVGSGLSRTSSVAVTFALFWIQEERYENQPTRKENEVEC